MSTRYYEVEPEDSQFYTIGIDLTHKCNMECANCYTPERDKPEFSTEQIEEFLVRLKNKTEVRFTGGEPTLRPDLPYLIKRARQLGHRPAIMTNGLKLASKEYCQTLKDAGLRFIALSMNGGDNNEFYKKMDGMPCADRKVKALENCAELGFFMNINCIVVKGFNESVIKYLADKMTSLNIAGTIRFRNIGQIGRHLKTENYTFEELLDLVPRELNIERPDYTKYDVVNGFKEKYNVLFPMNPAKKYHGIWIKITDWSPLGSDIPDPGSIRRGRLTQNLKVAPFFEDVRLLGY